MQKFEKLEPGQFYHIYNRGINGETLFKEARNYDYFMSLYVKYIHPIAHTYAYCLLGNHFHLLIKIRDAATNTPERGSKPFQGYEKPKDPSRQFSHLFNTYAQAINKAVGRTGGLFEAPFRRKRVDNRAYLSRLITYIHMNPEKHGLITDFREWEHSSYHAYLSEKNTRLERQEVLSLYGGKQDFNKAHQGNQLFNEIRELVEDDLAI